MLNKKEIASMYEKLNGTLVMNGEPVISDIYEFENNFFKNQEALDSLFELYGDATLVAYRKFKEEMLGKGVVRENIEDMYHQERNQNWIKAKTLIDRKKFAQYVYENIIVPKILVQKDSKTDATKIDITMEGKSNFKIDHSKAVEPTNLTEEDYKSMIDLALDTGDKEWFDELVAKVAVK